MTYVISDIHGQKDKFDTMLKNINFSENDHLYILGDVIDRGPDGIKIIQEIMKHDNMHMLLGNHEYVMLDALDDPYDEYHTTDSYNYWLAHNCGQPTLLQYKKLSNTEKDEIRKFLKNLPLNIDIEINNTKYKLVHACPVSAYYKFEQKNFSCFSTPASVAVWSRQYIMHYVDNSEYITIFGHTNSAAYNNRKFGKIAYLGNIIAIDCGCGIFNDNIAKSLGCLRLEDMQEFYVKYIK